MITAVAQRWRERRDSYRPAGEPIRTADYDVGLIGENVAKTFVITHHYSGAWLAARERVGLFRHGELVGAAVFSQPVSDLALAPFRGSDEAAELGRFVLLNDVPSNGETWFLARAFKLVRDSFAGVVSFSDPMPRRTSDGRELSPGHIGGIYQAHNAVYLKQAARNTIRLFTDGTTLNNRSISKLRGRERGWQGVVAKLEEHGAERYSGGCLRAWARLAIDATTRPVRHPGNHKYAWAIDRRMRRHLPASLPYPKHEANLAQAGAR